ncbi:hypothetical protein AS030_09650 [Fictibacillus enclensis]|uniref:Type II secretion system protein GspF domain-containing protein n=1 Tax=Fictibacillus enclensis TaxID=1017270 RepID=A0A0V8JFP3_9BACL|nr:competence type IV pilus assembly protein ComGB [Fictibacillus enclensis]KSU85740.1 hypothetical protein AS030_09650 [Fictibacillus enclensis]
MRKRERSWTKKQQGDFLLRLGRLLEQGYTLPKAISILKLHQHQWMKKGLYRVYDSLVKGYSLHEALASEKFSSEVLGFLELSEKHGDLCFSVMEGGKMLRKKEEIKERFLKAVRYPVFLFFIVLSVCFIMFRLLIPHFLALYSSLNIDFPWFTTFMINLLKKLPFFLGWMLAGAAATGTVYFFISKNMHPSRQIRFLLRIPLFNKLLAVWITHQFSVQIGSLLKGGLAINDALVILEDNQYMRFFRYEAAKMKQDLLNGLKFEDIVAQRRYFVPELSVIIAHGHTSGLLGKELIDYSEMLMSYAEEKLSRYIVIVQPVLFLFIGSTILVMFVSMLLPMFNMMDSIQ